MKKQDQTAITIPRSFAALSRAASTNKEAPPWMRTVRVEALASGLVRGTSTNGFGFLCMTAETPEVNLDLFGSVVASAPVGTVAAPGADDLAVVVKAVKAPKEGEPPPVEIILGAETMVRCGSEARRVQVEGGKADDGWPESMFRHIPTGEVVCAQLFGTELLRDMLTAILAAGAASVKVEMRGGLAGLCLVAAGENGEDVLGVLMPIRSKGETEEAPDKTEAGDDGTVTVSFEGREVTVTGQQFDKALREAGKP
jgi:hypothetical protein